MSHLSRPPLKLNKNQPKRFEIKNVSSVLISKIENEIEQYSIIYIELKLYSFVSKFQWWWLRLVLVYPFILETLIFIWDFIHEIGSLFITHQWHLNKIDTANFEKFIFYNNRILFELLNFLSITKRFAYYYKREMRKYNTIILQDLRNYIF